MHNWCLSVYVYGKVLAVHKITRLLFGNRDVSHIEQTAELCDQRFSDSNELVHLLDKLGVLRESRDSMPYVTHRNRCAIPGVQRRCEILTPPATTNIFGTGTHEPSF